MDIKLKYRAWVEKKHADLSYQLTNSDIETFAIEFAEHLLNNCNNKQQSQCCPSCKSTNFSKKEIRKDNGIIGSGYCSWVVDSYFICKDCGTHFSELK